MSVSAAPRRPVVEQGRASGRTAVPCAEIWLDNPDDSGGGSPRQRGGDPYEGGVGLHRRGGEGV